ncbi:MAG: alanine racemase [Acutalibacteraceae bacterium]|nr:alanine racemase [Acutalibacteraceae bacterium]
MDFLHRTWAEIDVDALVHNFEIIKKEADGAKLMAVVKADAYGHSARIVAPLLEQHGADAFAVSNIEEAITLRGCGITRPILILGYTPVGMAAQLYLNDITQCVYSPEYAAALSEKACADGVKIKIHIKLDTGMSRLGFNCRDEKLTGIEDAISAAKLEGFIFDGIFTHFAVSDRTKVTEDGFTDNQYSRFCAAVNRFKTAGLNPKCCHCCNSAAFCLDNDKHFDICRPGIILYGLTPSSDLKLKEDFIPVMTVKSVVSMVKTINKGDTVSYGRTFTAEKPMKIATVTAGYADGYPRLLSNKGYVLINGKKANIIGRICMDQMSVDVSDIDDVKQGDEVVLFGKNLPVEELADMCGTINYEIICGISPRVPRITVKGKKE